ncbi:hypothetical protein GEU84_020350 [Fertoebacter nigrum]|uniref:Uncharacterized protein n=1 Tax=Fertoeibacter niger TaxID=2656921 RepID=A0A8X8H6Q7_9RHOB|nr:hypothetical protein [Fertoeibacter niger]NUB46748.1 hypothetical protein [Fertoeibacter niger]
MATVTHFTTFTWAFAIVASISVLSLLAAASNCMAIKAALATVSRQMVSVAATFPMATPDLAGFLAWSTATYGDGSDGPDPALHVSFSCGGVTRWMSGSDNSMEVAGNSFLLGFQRADLETEVLRKGCGL